MGAQHLMKGDVSRGAFKFKALRDTLHRSESRLGSLSRSSYVTQTVFRSNTCIPAGL